ncbi:hypothetical protein HIM_02226 [Hirsutella minnesotensis 3608]|nr:hypothetical protein HIM_02226 [Hirsutella minnesotensis 3608]
MQGPDGYQPEKGEWVPASEVAYAESLWEDFHEVKSVLEELDVTKPSAEGIGSPHTQECVERQRTYLYTWAIYSKHSRDLNRDKPCPGWFKCKCKASGSRGWMWMEGLWDYNRDGERFCGLLQRPEVDNEWSPTSWRG